MMISRNNFSLNLAILKKTPVLLIVGYSFLITIEI